MPVPRKGVGPHIASTIEPFSQVFGNGRSVSLDECSCRDLSRDSPVLTSSFGKRREGKTLPLTRAVRSSADVYLKRVGDRTVFRIASSDRLGASGALGLCFVVGGHLLSCWVLAVSQTGRRQLLLPGCGNSCCPAAATRRQRSVVLRKAFRLRRGGWQRKSGELPIMGATQTDRPIPSRCDQLSKLSGDDVDTTAEPAHRQFARTGKSIGCRATDAQDGRSTGDRKQ